MSDGPPHAVTRREHRLVVRDLVKHFGSVRANDGIDLEFVSGEVHALLGENGAGKSTLIKILAGVYRPDSGAILLDGAPVRLENPLSSQAHGISVVHQDSTLVARLTVLENVIILKGGLWRPPPNLARRLVESGERLGFRLDPKARVESLTPGDRQRVEIARALMDEARFVILDEPTAVLSPREKTSFFGLLQGLAHDGIGVVFVTHHIGDALRYSQRVTVLRGGRVVGRPRLPADSLAEEAVVRMMVGEVEFHSRRAAAAPGEEVLAVRGLDGRLEGGRPLEEIDLSVRSGEVLGIAGVEGDGQRELAAALTGAWTPERGTVEIRGRPLRRYPRRERARMIADVPDDQLLATVNELSVWENLALTQLAWEHAPTPARKRKLRRWAVEKVREFGIRTPSVRAPVGQLSGGNRRRVVLARELSQEPEVAVLAFATKGLDVRSVEQVKRWTRRLADEGTAVVYISADLEEVLEVSDRIAVLEQGRIRGVLAAEEADVHRIGRLMLGASEVAEATG